MYIYIYIYVRIYMFPNNPPGDRWLSDSPFFTWFHFGERRRLDPLLLDQPLSPLTLNPSPPHAAIATC
jgi:hypothetical protein